jgi:hypothetical protein
MIRTTLMDGTIQEFPREEAIELVPYHGVFASSMLKAPLEGLALYRGKLTPVLGPLPSDSEANAPAETRAWLLVLKGCAQVIRGLPEFAEEAGAEVVPFPRGAAADESQQLLADLDELLKSTA